MAIISDLQCVKTKYSYQHIQGMMLLNLNKMVSKIKLTHSEYRVMCTLIGLYNKSHNKAFPTIEYLAKACLMGKTTVGRCLSKLVEYNLLIIVKTPGKRNNYYFSNLIFDSISTPHVKLPSRTACKTTHDNKQIKIKTDIKTSFYKTNDAFLKKPSLEKYKNIQTKLKTWGFLGVKNTINKIGLNKLEELIKIVEKKEPENKGAYLRSFLNELDSNPDFKIKQPSIVSECTQIEQMLEYQYWKHLPTGKIYAVKPDIGIHLLIRYHKNLNMVEFLEHQLIDKLDNFAIIKTNDSN